MFNQKDKDDFFQWGKDTGKIKYELAKVLVNNNGVFEYENKMAWVLRTSPEDYKEFCEVTGRECEGEIILQVIY